MKQKEKWDKEKWDKLVKAILIYWQDLQSYTGGWIYFVGRMILNAFWLYLAFGFIWNWYHFVYSNVGLEAELIPLKNILWVFGLVFMFVRTLSFYDFDKLRRR